MPHSLRVSGDEVLIVPPFECAWLDGLSCERGRLAFEARGETDATVILKQASSFGRRNQTEERAYTVILGSHRNSTVKVEKNGALCTQVAWPGCLSASAFSPFWLRFCEGRFSVGRGAGADADQEVLCSWTDPEPLAGAFHIGLSAWDRHVAFRGVAVQPCRPDRQEAYREGPGPAAVPSLASLCAASLLAQPDAASACEVLCLADAAAPELAALEQPYVEFVAGNLQEILTRCPGSFLALPEAVIGRVLACPGLACSELEAFSALALWAEGQGPPLEGLSSPQGPWERLVQHIRFPLMAPAELRELEAQPLVRQSPCARELLSEALQYQAEDSGDSSSTQAAQPGALAVTKRRHVVSSTPSLALERFRRRTGKACVNLLYVHDGDSNGVCYHLGSGGGRRAWVNPAASGALSVDCSSPPCRQTDARALVGATFCRHNFAGPQPRPGGPAAAWWQLDLGPGRLACDYYTLRQDGSRAFPRDWALQGWGGEGVGWVTLRQHSGDAALSLPAQYASWPVTGRAARTPYQRFRVVLTGPTACDGARGDAFHLAWWELYGQLSWAGPA